MALAIAIAIAVVVVVISVLNNTSYITIPAYQGHNSFCLYSPLMARGSLEGYSVSWPLFHVGGPVVAKLYK